MESLATEFSGAISRYTSLEGSSDASLDVLLSLRQAELYAKFGFYLRKVAAANPQVAQLIGAKGQESINTAKAYQDRCLKIINSASLFSPVNSFCQRKKNPEIVQAVKWNKQTSPVNISHVSDKELMPLKKEVFAIFDSERVLKLSKGFYDKGAYHYAMAASSYGLSLGNSQGDFQTIMGCSVLKLGYLAEAEYYLKQSTNYLGMGNDCKAKLNAKKMEQ